MLRQTPGKSAPVLGGRQVEIFGRAILKERCLRTAQPRVNSVRRHVLL